MKKGNETMKNRNLTYIAVDYLHPHPNNPRKALGDLTELVESIKQSGIMQNLTVVERAEGGFTVIIGHRRLGAAKIAGLAVVPCVIVEMNEKEQLATMMLENMQRSDLTYYEQAEGFQLMMDLGESVESISDKTGLSKTTVRNRVKLAKYDREIMREAASRQPTMEQYMRLCEIEDIERANEVAKFLGTSNFDREVDRALSQQKSKKQRDELLAAVEAVAVKWDGDVHEDVKDHKIVCVDHFYTPVTGDTVKKLKILSDTYDNLYYNEGYGFAIFRDYVAGDDDKKTEQEINKAKREELDKRADSLYFEMRSRAIDFVKNYRSKKEHYDVLVAHLFNAVISGKLTAHYEILRTAEALGWKMPESARTWEDETRMAAETYIAECFERDKPRTILFVLWHMLPESKPFYLRYDQINLQLSSRHGWYRLFEILTDVGYNVLDEEWSILGGSHPIFSEEVPL